MGIWGKIFGADDVIEKAADGIYNGIDKLVYTDEEKADMRLKAAEQFLKLLKAYEPFKLAQRLLALIIAIPYVAVWLVSAILFVWGALTQGDFGTHIIEVSKQLAELNNETLREPLAIILAFYFTGGMLEGAIGKWKEKSKD